MTSRERLQAALDHDPCDRLCVDLGAGNQTGIGVCALHHLRQAVLGEADYRVRICEPYQMLGQVDEALRRALRLDVVGVPGPSTMFGFPCEDYKPFTMLDSTPCLVPGQFNWTVDAEGAILMYPEGDTSVPPSAKMPSGSYFFDAIMRQHPLDESGLDPNDNCEEFGFLSDTDLAFYDRHATELHDTTDYGIYMTLPGTAFGDNDRLSALVASKLDADLLIILSDVNNLYDKNPREHSDANPIDTVPEITEEIFKMAGGKGSTHSTGGMKTKIQAAHIAAQAGCRIVLAHGREPHIITRIMAGEMIGTIFLPQKKLSNRARWILHSTPQGQIHVDDGAMQAMRQRKSLLPSGITGVEGSFEAGAVVQINGHIKAVTSLSSEQIIAIMGKHSSEIKTILGPHCRDVVAIPEDIVVVE